jgi:nucleotide-binding universal stress UspA family protein
MGGGWPARAKGYLELAIQRAKTMAFGRLFKRSRPAAGSSTAQRVLLASEGRRFSDEVIDFAADLARARDGRVRVLTIARLWGTGLGLPHPGLRPNKREMAEHEANIERALQRLKNAGIEADGHIITTRHPCKSILGEARRQACGVIVMGADQPRNWLIRDFMWSQEPYRVRRRASIPIHLIGP